jgi:hypothetical protein
LSLGLILDALDPGATSAAAVGFFATTITPGAAGGRVSSLAGGISSVIPVGAAAVTTFLPYTLGLQPNNNGGLYDLALQVTTPAGTVAATAVGCGGWIKYMTVSQPWAR